MRIISVINTSSTHRTKERSLQRTPMQIMAVAFAASALAFGLIAFAAGGPSPDVSTALAAAVADSSRPDSDTTRDADRKPEQTLAFSGIKPGDKVADYVADAGYFTRLFSSVVGSNGSCLCGGAHRLLQVQSFPHGSRGAPGLCRHPSERDGHDCRGARRT